MKLCLNLIVRDEEENIYQCLESFNQLEFHALAIVDTGSVDRTVEIIEEWRKKRGKKGGVLSAPWKKEFGPFHFAFNRNLALDYAYQVIEEESGTWYILFSDADNRLKKRGKLEELKEEAYYVLHEAGKIEFPRLSLIKYNPPSSPRVTWSWKGGLHEFLTPSTGEVSASKIDSFSISARTSGCREKDNLKYIGDYLFLQDLLKTEPAELYPRNLFYLAQSLRDCKLGKEVSQTVEKLYLKRGRLEKGDIEERYVAYLEAFKQRFFRKGLDEKAGIYLQEALNLFPQRLEAPFYYIQFLSSMKRNNQAWIVGSEYLRKLNKCPLALFREKIIYDFGFYDSLASVALTLGKKEEARMLWGLAYENAPEEEKKRFQSYLERL